MNKKELFLLMFLLLLGFISYTIFSVYSYEAETPITRILFLIITAIVSSSIFLKISEKV